MSFVKVSEDGGFETYRVKCDGCGMYTGEFIVAKGLKAAAQREAKKACKDADLICVGGNRHLCFSCDAKSPAAEQFELVPSGPKRKRWRPGPKKRSEEQAEALSIGGWR